MAKKVKCPMMMYGMPMVESMEMNMPNMMNAPNMMNMPMVEMELHYEDEEDDRYFMRHYSDPCKKMMPYVEDVVDRMEDKDNMMHEKYPDREAIRTMIEDVYRSVIRDMPDMAEEDESRQYPRRRFVRDILGVLLLNELFRRRRRRRRYPYGYPYSLYDNDDDFDYYYDD